MIRNIKVLGLSVVAMLAMTAMVASAASAANFTASSYPASGSGGQTTEHVFTVQGSTVKCKTANFTGSLSAASETMSITPEYKECTAFGFINATVNMNGCTYEFKTGAGSGDNWAGTVVVKCPTGKEITVEAGPCVVHIPAQTPTTNKVSFTNETGSPNKVLVKSEVEGIHSKVTSGFLCPLTSKELDTTGKYTGTTRFEGAGGVGVDIG